MAIAMAALLVFELLQRQTIRETNELRADSVIALAFQCEREFMRFRASVDAAANGIKEPDLDNINLRFDLFQSRLTLLRDNPSTTVLTGLPEYVLAVPALDKLVARTETLLAKPSPSRAEFSALVDSLNALGPNIQALTMVATSTVSHRLEQQDESMLRQNDLIIGLTVAQLLMLLVAAGALLARQKRQELDRQALEAINVELQVAKMRAEEASRAKSQFLANMSHELRTPFNGMMGMMQLLEFTGLNDTQKDYVATAQSSARHLLGLLNDILDVAALESGKLKLAPVPTELRGVFLDVQALMAPQAEAKGLRFTGVSEPEFLPWAEIDAKRFKQIVFNLLSNAIKFTEHGSVQLKVHIDALGGGAAALICEVSDSGVGMKAEVLSNLFQRFYQADASINRKFGGSGLGLEISQTLAHMMGGAITATSEEGKGSLFTLRIPLVLCAPGADSYGPVSPEQPALAEFAVEIDNKPSMQAINTLAPISESSVAPVHVLVVEDHPINRKLIGVLLKGLGCTVTFCEDGQQAVETVVLQTFDVILMDVNMPVMDGLTATRTIRAMGGSVAAIPIIVFTADVMNEAKERANAAGANDFLPKPVKISELKSALLKYVGPERLR
jgi:signal transduction histidine kinase/CheY-like chemotaxis protein